MLIIEIANSFEYVAFQESRILRIFAAGLPILLTSQGGEWVRKTSYFRVRPPVTAWSIRLATLVTRFNLKGNYSGHRLYMAAKDHYSYHI